MSTRVAQLQFLDQGIDILQLIGEGGNVLFSIDKTGAIISTTVTTASVFKASNTLTVATGTIYALRGRSENHVASMTGTVVGVSGYAANYTASAGGNINAGEFVALTKGVAIGTERAIFAQLDGGGGASTSVKAVCVEANNQATGTVTNGPWAFSAFDNSDANASGAPFAAILRVESNSLASLIGPIIDATGVQNYVASFDGITLTTGDVPLFAFKDSAGTKHVLVVIQNSTDIAIRS